MGRRSAFETPGDECVLSADVCVVGAGPAGLTIALHLAGSGLEVLLLEAGPDRPPRQGVDITTTTSTGLPYPLLTTRSAGVGGSSLRWSVETPAGPDHVRLKELDPEDFEPVVTTNATGWPFSRAHIERHYAAARAVFGLGHEAEDDDAVAPGIERRVYSFSPRTVVTEELPRSVRDHPRVRLLTDLTVTDIRTDGPDARVTSLAGRLDDGAEVRVRARQYVLACGGLENARLLLASRSRFTSGLGNGHDLVGRHFMEHPHYPAGVIRPGSTGLLRHQSRWDLILRGGQVHQDKYTLDVATRSRHGLLAAAYKVKPFVVTDLPFGHDGRVAQAGLDAWVGLSGGGSPLGGRRRAAVDLARVGPALLRHLARRTSDDVRRVTGRAALPAAGHRVLVMAEQEPSPSSRLRLSTRLDRHGVPEAELDWRLSATDLRSMGVGQRLMAPPLGALLGVDVVSTIGPGGATEPGGGAHHMGTTRMSRSPRTGVVDEHCRVHGIPNLSVAGSSVFPLGGAANPTLTIVALAIRLAERLSVELQAPGHVGRHVGAT